MCGIVAACARRNVVPVLVEGLKALEYRGYDSAGVLVETGDSFRRARTQGKVRELENLLAADPLDGSTGIAHTRWATHGAPNTRNAHPHVSGDLVGVVHNGIIENHAELRDELVARGYHFDTETDSEVVAHLVHAHLQDGDDLRTATQRAVARLHGAYAIAVVSAGEPGRAIGARQGSPLVVGVGEGENFLASDVQALIRTTRHYIFLEEGDLVDIDRDSVTVIDRDGNEVQRPVKASELSADAVEKGEYRHYMLKEIHEQPRAIADTLEARIAADHILPNIFGVDTETLLRQVRFVQIVACGTSYHAGLVARYWLEELAGIPCAVEVASEYRYRQTVVPPGTLFVAISQSGETADTLAAMRASRSRGHLGVFAVCNAPESSLVREADLVLMTRAGPEIGVASTKAFTTQLAALALLSLELGRINGLDDATYRRHVSELATLPRVIGETLAMEPAIAALAERFVHKQHALFLGRGTHHPVALEGALKLKEISYIHAEAYPAGELKHGPLALVDDHMPVIAVAPNNQLLEKLKSNLEEVRARGGELFVFADADTGLSLDDTRGQIINIGAGGDFIAPAVFTVPLQLLAYHVAVLRGTDVDQPRNLAKSVTVE
ncbi:glutamine--fructose-6-phosphate transaminase (isomerizing) [Pseudofulvimonas gallinarii]|jgi:glucosamine--fructose-6-phosphate aminotransferase (isomerizing)|uniref:Glutamine--fructose-6-phosphate aminotransferase [isomerizing] n=1 Tax=Pseudofulvimonas gallinarii TaxID=634155 RepID=A0A4S3KTP9_9GAMM|nr:glutamine--fructose-6-phosphate transaminase (isomerizing) [Pseudofulvimonas gallinarii]TCS97183.1 glutamine--fructose-6-phosphate transaminase [Pseudofulvimonas gallinarii]THD12542.1 glutamine--fructose-6-phosphate transaminase (isomerizing) [Pseudofulvimonas gallinarii]